MLEYFIKVPRYKVQGTSQKSRLKMQVRFKVQGSRKIQSAQLKRHKAQEVF